MDITLAEIVTVCSGLLVLFAFRKELYNTFVKPDVKQNERLNKLEQENEAIKKEVKESKVERLILCKGLLACLKGLQEQGCNGPVTQGIKDLEEYLLNSSHDA
jgi:hypothetical protein